MANKIDHGIININGLVPGKLSIGLQSAPDYKKLGKLIADYLVREIRKAGTVSDVELIQKIFGMRASRVPELAVYDFEPNQRVDELLTILIIAQSTNALSSVNMIPAWQRPNQDSAMEAFTGKKSWDGFIYEHVPFSVYKPEVAVMPIPIEVKSLKINPYKEKFTDLNDLLRKKIPKFSKYFQSEASIAAILIFPIGNSVNLRQRPISFNMIDAVAVMNQYVASNVIGCLVFVDIVTDDETYTSINLKCTFTSKDPDFANKASIHNIRLFESKLVRFQIDTN